MMTAVVMRVGEPRARRFLRSASLLLTLNASCADFDDSRRVPSESDSSLASPVTLPAVSIGGNDEREGYLIANANAALRLSDGRIVIGDAGLRQVRYYDARGQHIRTEGGLGNGPGQFQQLGRISRAEGDTIFAWDRASNRYTLLPPEGGPPITRTIPNLREMRDDLRGRYSGGIAGFEAHPLNGGWTILQPIVEPIVPQDTRLIRDTVPLVAVDNGGVVSELGVFPGTLRSPIAASR